MSLFFVEIAYAATDPDALARVLNPIISNIINPLLELVFALAIVIFAYGVFQVVWGDEESHDRGKKSMWYGVIGMFIMISAWGIVNLVASTVQGFK